MKLIPFIFSSFIALTLAGCGSDSDNSFDPTSKTARYELKFDTDWSAVNFPTNFPENRHFSGLIGLTHDKEARLIEPNVLADDGLVSVAETGSKDLLISEVNLLQNLGYVGNLISGDGIPVSDYDVDVQFDISQDFPLVTVVTMLAPSPDWFTGIDSVELFANGAWVNEVTVQAFVYDAGSDSGVTFTSENDPTIPRAPISLLTTPRVDTDFEKGVHYQNQLHIGTFKLKRVD